MTEKPMRIEDGTMVRTRSSNPSPAYKADVSNMPLEERFAIVLERTGPRLPGELQEEWNNLMNPMNVVIIVVTLAAWAVSHYFGVGFIIDMILMVAGAAFLGWQIGTAAADFFLALRLTAEAKTDDDLTQAAAHLANFVAVVGVAVFTALVMKGAKRVAPKVKQTIRGMAGGKWGGMIARHYLAFQQVAKQSNRIIIVRWTKPACAKWIERGFPAKPKSISNHGIKTDPDTGIVTAKTTTEVKGARSEGYYVVDGDDIPRRFVIGTDGVRRSEVLRFDSKPDWPIEPGQVIDPTLKKPLVGDYDLLSVIDPNAKGRNIVSVPNDIKGDYAGAHINRVREALNAQMDRPRVMHGAQDGFDSISMLDEAEEAMGFFPDGSTRRFKNGTEVRQFFNEIGRQDIKGKYESGPLGDNKFPNVKQLPPKSKIRGEPEHTISAADAARETHQAERYANRMDVAEVHMGQEAKKAYKSPAGEKFPDVVAKKTDGTYALGEGKGTDMRKVVEQFEAAGARIRGQGGRISEQEVVVERLQTLSIDGKVVKSPGAGYGVDDLGYLLNMTGPPPWPRQLANGLLIKVIVKP
jgi:hypothetical protein